MVTALNKIPPRDYDSYQISFLQKTIPVARLTGTATTITIGRYPRDAIVLKVLMGFTVEEALNAGSGNTIDLGWGAYTNKSGTPVVADPNGFATAMSVASLADWVEADETPSNFWADSDENGVELTATINYSSTAPTKGIITVTSGFFHRRAAA